MLPYSLFSTILASFFIFSSLFGSQSFNLHEKVQYVFTEEPIDVVIPCTEKDLETLERCIDGIKKNGINIRRVIVVSSHQFTDKAEWFDEALYPFSKFDLAKEIFGNEHQARHFCRHGSRIGWVYQQFLKLYAPFVIPNISSNVLILDSDTTFLNPTCFTGNSGEGLLTQASEFHPPYFEHMSRLIPGFRKVTSDSGVAHHMLFQRCVLEDLFAIVESHHGTEMWRALCRCIDLGHVYFSSLSEYEIYFNFVLTRTDQVKVRSLRWEPVYSLDGFDHYQNCGHHYVTCHAWSR